MCCMENWFYSKENRFFPSSDVTRVLRALMTSLDGKKLFHGAHALDQNPGIANLVILVTLGSTTMSSVPYLSSSLHTVIDGVLYC